VTVGAVFPMPSRFPWFITFTWVSSFPFWFVAAYAVPSFSFWFVCFNTTTSFPSIAIATMASRPLNYYRLGRLLLNHTVHILHHHHRHHLLLHLHLLHLHRHWVYSWGWCGCRSLLFTFFT
jgi:hypothetical protein